ncbi:MAG: GH92 family glycosyl hydrolase [Brevundimonas sp.]
MSSTRRSLFRRTVAVVASSTLVAGALVAIQGPAASAAAGDFSSGFETGDTQPTWQNSVINSSNVGGYNASLTAMESGPRTGELSHAGTTALMYSGNDLSATGSFSYNRVFDVDIPVTSSTTLTYWIYPQAGGHLDVALDLTFTDGSALRDSGAVDQTGTRVHPAFQGLGGRLVAGQWNQVISSIGSWVAGKTIDHIDIGYDQPANTGTFRGYVDDISITAGGGTNRLSSYVDTRRGSNSSGSYSRGNTFPGTTVPNGFNFWTPVTNGNADNWLYEWNKSTVQGFAISHEPSPWIGDYGQLQIMPMTGGVKSTPDARKSSFSHANEIAQAHYYKTKLDTYNITTEITPTDHAGVFRFTFPSASDSVILFDTIDSAGGSINVDQANRKITGYSDQKSRRLYFSATVDKAIAATGNVSGQGATGWIRFATAANEQVTMKVGTSWISVDQAAANLSQEVGSKSFDTVKEEAATLWDNTLGKAKIEGASNDRMVTFYSNMYRAFMYPNNRSEIVNGVRRYNSPYDGQVHDGQMYVNNGFWDTSRAVWPLYTLLAPTKTGNMLDGMTNAYKDGGWTARWTGPGYIDIMVGTNQDLAFADAYVKGVRNFDYTAAYDSMVKNASVYSSDGSKGRKSNEVSIFKGYVPNDVRSESASWTIEDANADFGIYQMATALGKTEDAAYFKNRSLWYANLWSPSVGFFRGKNSNGTWRTSDANFKPQEWGCEFTEGNAWNYVTTASQDPQGMANLMGGRSGLSAKIDSVFNASRDFLPGCYGGTIHEMTEAYDTNMGQYAHSNEPIHAMVYMYNYAGTPSKTQTHVRDILTKLYDSGAGTGNGYLGDEDNGEMSAWYIFSALGFYPARMGSLDYTIGAPLSSKSTITLEDGKTFTVNAPGVSDTNRYIQSATLNGVSYTKNYITHGDLTAGGTLSFVMGPNPSSWGTGTNDVPASITSGSTVPVPLSDKLVGGTVTASAENGTNENAAKVVDDTSMTKWLANSSTATLTYAFGGGASHAVKQYTLTSGNDAPERDPKAWTLQGSNDGSAWTTVDTRSNIDFNNRRQTRAFVIGNTTAYKQYRLQITANHSGNLTQLAEWELLAPGS